MLRIAILETEEIAKQILYIIAKYFQQEDCSCYCFTKISQFAKAEADKDFQVVFFHEKMEVPRVTQSFVLNKPQRIVIYVKSELTEIEKEILPFARIFYIQRKEISSEMLKILPYLSKLIHQQEEYLFSYNNVEVPLKISDIYYIEKEDKMLIYHTKRGEFRERKNMKDAFVFFEPYDFLWIHASYLVNMEYILKIENDTVVLPKISLPISRAKKARMIEVFHSYIEKK